jgi:hypothetical protein
MKDSGKAFIVVSGDFQTRLNQAKKAVGALL